ncbi:unnamed protein product [Adineta steineri]|uniref:BZIP domain-containing protein n=1 Tax=Adineta steineri TaxID=433720 RepID=A0A814GK84_9BILA|nr:unnamed protein product [Adineta steineri]CAF1216863.1 unnamed protein product [Adineta steineri]
MCMDTPHLDSQNFQSKGSIIETKEEPLDNARYLISSSENSPTSCGGDDDNDIIEFGPIKVKPRKKPAPTLATGRRSKYETLSPEEEQKRDLRRARNRAAAERVRINRLTVEQQLQGQIDALEQQEENLSSHVDMLEQHKLRLETRILTHDKICSNMNSMNILDDYLPAPTVNNTSTFKQMEQVSQFDFDELFPESTSSVQMQQNNMLNFPSTIISDDDFYDPLMDL